MTAIDAAGNQADETVFMTTSKGCVFNKNNYTGKFILDTEKPVVTKIVTMSAENLKKQAYPITDDKVYGDTESVYYNKNVKVLINIKDAYVREGLFEGRMNCAGKPAVDAVVSRTDSGLTATYTLNGDNEYKKLVLTGADKAGNPLLLSENYKRNGASDVDKLIQSRKDSAEGKVSLRYGIVID